MNRTVIHTPIGPMVALTSAKGLCFFDFADREDLDQRIERLSKKVILDVVPNEEIIRQLSNQLEEYFSGKRQHFELPLDLNGTAFQQTVWEALQKIPFGQTCSYQSLAEGINNPKAVRAVAKANADNLLLILLPCHRIIGKNGTLTGYAGGLPRKEFLLKLEGQANNPAIGEKNG